MIPVILSQQNLHWQMAISKQKMKLFLAAQKSYQDYGYSVACFFKEHNLPQQALEETYANYVADITTPCLETQSYIKTFPGPQLVLSHSPKPWVDAVIRKNNIASNIPEEWRITSEIIGYQGKELSADPYIYSAKILGIAPEYIAVFEDTARNLPHAKSLGMTTILVTNGKAIADKPDYVDHIVNRPYDIKNIL